MIEFINDADLFLQAAETRVLDYQDTLVLVTPSAPYFKVAPDGTGAPGSIIFTATLLNLEGEITFSISGGTLTNITAKTATLAYADMASGTAVITATVMRNGQPFSGAYALSKVRDGEPGTIGVDGLPGASTGNAKLYLWSTVVPPTPVGTATFTWGAASNTGYNGTDGWAITIPSNPGTPLAKLWVADKPISAPAGTVSTAVTYASGSTIAAQSQNGANGAQAADATVYQWAATIPAGPSGAATFDWPSATFGAAPANWSLTPGQPPSPGMTLFAARVRVTDSAGNATTGFNWSAAAVMAISYAGQAGSSYVTAYCASATASATSAPTQTTGKTSLPAANSGGITGTYSAVVPTLTAGQYLYQTDGIYDPATDKITWSIPYWSSLKVAILSAISANLGAITGGSIDIGTGATSWHVDAAGNQWAGAPTFAAAPFRVANTGAAVMTAMTIQKPDGTVLLNSSGLTEAGAAPLTASIIGIGGKNRIAKNSLPTSDSGIVTTNPFGLSLDGDGSLFAGPLDALAKYSPGATGCTYMHVLGTPAANTYVTMVHDTTGRVPVVEGKRYEFSVALSVHRCSARVIIGWYNSSGSFMSETAGSFVDVPAEYPVNLDFPRSLVFAVAPVGATSAQIYTRQYHNGTTNNDCYTFASQWYFGEALPAQTVGSPWSESPTALALDTANKLNKNAADILKGPIALQANGAIQVGTATYANGVLSGTGVTITPYGLAVVKDGIAQITMNNSGVIQSINLSTLSANIGMLRTAASGSRIELSDNLMEGFASNNVRRFRLSGS